MEDKRAHDRLDQIELKIKQHGEAQLRFEQALAANTELTKTIAENTTELVQIVNGAKGLRSFILWVTPIAAATTAVVLWFRGH